MALSGEISTDFVVIPSTALSGEVATDFVVIPSTALSGEIALDFTPLPGPASSAIFSSTIDILGGGAPASSAVFSSTIDILGGGAPASSAIFSSVLDFTIEQKPSNLFSRGSPTTLRRGTTLLGSVAGVDLTAIGATSLYSVGTGRTAIIDLVIVRCTEATSITTPAVAGVGVASGEDDVIEAQALFGLTTSGVYYVFPGPGGMSVELSAGQSLKLGVDTGAIGTSQVATVDVLGREF